MTSNLKFYISVTKELKLKIRNFGGLIPTFVEVMGEKLEGGLFTPFPLPFGIGLKHEICVAGKWLFYLNVIR